ncbi:MAG: crossover junction endodeoxyribonuclease RuvC [Bacteroidetes bacterium]|nr:crossover junction endodeoxyribonuclease RuvC [Bacteroidota bacterium]
MIILGVDPGSRFTGYGVVEVDGSATTVIEYGVFALDGRGDHHLKLREIYDSVTDVIERCKPDECAIEMPIYGKNAQSMLKLGRAQAAAILAALNRDIPVMQYTPKEVKKSVTGNGAASKEQVWYMVRSLLAIRDSDETMGLDASDALAVVLCHSHRNDRVPSTKGRGGWEAFVRDNPGRVVSRERGSRGIEEDRKIGR